MREILFRGKSIHGEWVIASFIDISASNCEVIGNIHDNPELLEVSGDEP